MEIANGGLPASFAPTGGPGVYSQKLHPIKPLPAPIYPLSPIAKATAPSLPNPPKFAFCIHASWASTDKHVHRIEKNPTEITKYRLKINVFTCRYLDDKNVLDHCCNQHSIFEF